MNYKLKFLPSAQKEWNNLDNSIKTQFKHSSAGYRLVYEVDDQEIVILVIAIGKREHNSVYDKAQWRT